MCLLTLGQTNLTPPRLRHMSSPLPPLVASFTATAPTFARVALLTQETSPQPSRGLVRSGHPTFLALYVSNQLSPSYISTPITWVENQRCTASHLEEVELLRINFIKRRHKEEMYHTLLFLKAISNARAHIEKHFQHKSIKGKESGATKRRIYHHLEYHDQTPPLHKTQDSFSRMVLALKGKNHLRYDT